MHGLKKKNKKKEKEKEKEKTMWIYSRKNSLSLSLSLSPLSHLITEPISTPPKTHDPRGERTQIGRWTRAKDQYLEGIESTSLIHGVESEDWSSRRSASAPCELVGTTKNSSGLPPRTNSNQLFSALLPLTRGASNRAEICQCLGTWPNTILWKQQFHF